MDENKGQTIYTGGSMAIYALAIDSLTDKDGKFNIRKYFLSK